MFQGARGPNGSAGEKVKRKSKAFSSSLRSLWAYYNWAVGLEVSVWSREEGGTAGEVFSSLPAPHKCTGMTAPAYQVQGQLARQLFLHHHAVPTGEFINLIKCE